MTQTIEAARGDHRHRRCQSQRHRCRELRGRCLAGRSGISRIDGIDTLEVQSTVAAQVTGFRSAERDGRRRGAARAADGSRWRWRRRAKRSNRRGFTIDPDDIELQRKIGVSLGTGGGGLAFVEEQYRAFFTEGTGVALLDHRRHARQSLQRAVDRPAPARPVARALDRLHQQHRRDRLRRDAHPRRRRADDARRRGRCADRAGHPHGLREDARRLDAALGRSGASRRGRSARDRDGFVLGEGAWMFVLEDREHALARGATILAELAGYGSTCDAYHRVQIAPDVDEPVRAIELALADARRREGRDRLRQPARHQHRAERPHGDRCDEEVLSATRARQIPMSSTKSMIGHPQGACGAAGLAATVLCMRRGVRAPDDQPRRPRSRSAISTTCRTTLRRATCDVALCNCIAFGSKNSALVVVRVAMRDLVTLAPLELRSRGQRVSRFTSVSDAISATARSQEQSRLDDSRPALSAPGQVRTGRRCAGNRQS